ncbi:MAG: hypothetical protein QXN26_07235 [Thermoplasmataceae archaeon]
MILSDGDYSDLVTYLTGLFNIKKIKSVTIDRYTISYGSCYIIDDLDTASGHTTDEFPSDNEKDRVKSLLLHVSGINGRSSNTVEIGWDSVRIDPDVHPRLARDFIDMLDRSTFRYF